MSRICKVIKLCKILPKISVPSLLPVVAVLTLPVWNIMISKIP